MVKMKKEFDKEFMEEEFPDEYWNKDKIKHPW